MSLNHLSSIEAWHGNFSGYVAWLVKGYGYMVALQIWKPLHPISIMVLTCLSELQLCQRCEKKNPEKKILPDKRQLHSFTIQESLQNRKPYYISLCYQSQHNKLSVQMVFQQEMNPYLTSEPHHFDKMQKSRCFILVTLCQTPSFGLRMIQESCSVCLRGTDWRWWGKNML